MEGEPSSKRLHREGTDPQEPNRRAKQVWWQQSEARAQTTGQVCNAEAGPHPNQAVQATGWCLAQWYMQPSTSIAGIRTGSSNEQGPELKQSTQAKREETPASLLTALSLTASSTAAGSEATRLRHISMTLSPGCQTRTGSGYAQRSDTETSAAFTYISSVGTPYYFSGFYKYYLQVLILPCINIFSCLFRVASTVLR